MGNRLLTLSLLLALSALTHAQGPGPPPCQPFGTNYCSAGANSASPQGATLFGLCGIGIASNDLTLLCEFIGAGQPAVFFHGPTQIRTPFGDGFRCVGGSLVRLWPPTVANGSGTVLHNFDNTGPGGVGVAAGATRNFQCWYRDPAGGPAGFNLSNGLAITFAP
jgi:hypothetical protein